LHNGCERAVYYPFTLLGERDICVYPEPMNMELTRLDHRTSPYLDGHFLVSMPGMGDEHFQRSLIYVCAHSEEGAMGIIVNKTASDLRFSQLLVQLDIISEHEAIRLPSRADDIHVLKGGPVESGRGFVLHSPDYLVAPSTHTIAEGVCMTVTLDILRAIARGEGPHQALLALGYAGWSPGQLEKEIKENGWLVCPGDASLVFDMVCETKYERALRKMGIDPACLSLTSGTA
jgi:putative transcriptional regulator